MAGRTAFVESCAPCHASRDGFDLAYFGFPDTAVARRATPHVDPKTAVDIAAFIVSIPVSGVPRGTRPFQPGGVVMSSDVAFAELAFESDAWPAGWSTEDLRAVDPLRVRVAVPLPRWSEEATNLDWMPDKPLTEGLLGYAAGRVESALTRYYASRTWESLGRAVAALRVADRDPASADSPCRREAIESERCFETRRWTASLVAQHMVRESREEPVHPLLHDAWWDVGNAARLSLRAGTPVDRAVENWASWMLLGWIFDPGRHASIYTGSALMRLELPRHATYVALRSEVARPPGSIAPYLDARNAARFAPAHWAFHATRFALVHLVERLDSGDAPRDGARLEAGKAVVTAWAASARKVVPEEREELAELRDAVLARLE